MLGRTVSHYRIVERLGQGAMGVVYRAEDLQLGRTVALKFLPAELTRDEEAKERFLTEARAASRLDHPNICTVHEVGRTDDGAMFIVMACYDGESLAAKISRGPMPPREALDIVTQLARGLAKAHAAGIVHRDVKPANVILTSEGVAKLVDFGVVKLSGVDVTRDGAPLGTLSYMAPEQFSTREVTPAADVWSLGVVLYEMLTGRLPFEADNQGALIMSILHDEPQRPALDDPATSALMERLLSGMLKKNPRDRFADAARLLTFVDPQAGGEKPLPSFPRRPKLRTALAGAAVLAIAVAGVIAGVRHWSDSTGAPSEAAAALSPASHRMIAVMPFQNLGAPGDAFFADGITEEIITRLAAVEGVGVISRTSVYAYDRAGRSARQIGRDLGVDYILDGTVRWERDGARSRVRVTPQLIRAADDTQVWGDRYDRDFAQVFDMQSEIARNVIGQLGLRLAAGNAGGSPTASSEAYDNYLRALPARFSYAEEELRTGIAQAERATTLDPAFASAHALLGHLHVRLYHQGFDRSRERLDLSARAIERAVSLQPENPDSHVARGYLYYWGSLDHEKALAEFAQAQKARPGDATLMAGIGFVHRRQGRVQLALSELLAARKLDPHNQNLLAETALTLSALHRFDEADRLLARGIRDFPAFSLLYTYRFANEIIASGSTARAKALLAQAPDTDEETLVSARWALALFEGDAAAALEILRRTDRPFFVTTVPFGYWGTVRHPRALLVAQAEQAAGHGAAAREAFGEALTAVEAELRKNPDDDRSHAALALALAGLGRNGEAVREAERAVALSHVERNAIDGPTRMIELARVYAMTGDREKARKTLDAVLARPSTFTAKLLALDPGWKSLGGAASAPGR